MISRKIANKFYLSAMSVVRRKRTLVKTWAVSLVVSVLLIIAITSYNKSSDLKKTSRSILEEHMFETMDGSGRDLSGLSDICDDRSNRTLIVHQYRNLIKKMVKESMAGVKSTVSESDTCHLPKDILTNPRHKAMIIRIQSIVENCKNPTSELTAKAVDGKLLQNKDHNLVVCRNPKAASSALGVYTNALFVYTVLDMYASLLKNFSTHHLIENHNMRPDNSRKGGINKDDKLNFVAVRHPFQRSVSAYVNKVYEHNAYKFQIPEMYSEMQKLSSLNPYEAKVYIGSILQGNGTRPTPPVKIRKFECLHKIKTMDPASFDSSKNKKYGKPSFRGFALAVAVSLLHCHGDPDCLDEKEKHFKSQTIKCTPCTANYDAVVKAETLQEDMNFIEELMRLPRAWDLHQKILAGNDFEISKLTKASQGAEGDTYTTGILRANVSKRDKMYEEYMSELTEEELNLLYTAYYNDFALYGYDPCEGL